MPLRAFLLCPCIALLPQPSTTQAPKPQACTWGPVTDMVGGDKIDVDLGGTAHRVRYINHQLGGLEDRESLHLETEPMSVLLPLPHNARSALAIVDMQEFFFRKPERRQGLEKVIENINRLIGFFEARDWPVVHVITCYKADGSDWDLKMRAAGVPELIEGSPQAAILPQIEASPRHHVVKKTRYSAFFKTGLADWLQAQRVQRLLVTGAYTHYCVNATVFDAYAHDLVPGIVTDAVISHLPDESALLIARMRRNGYHIFSTDEWLKELTPRRKEHKENQG